MDGRIAKEDTAGDGIRCTAPWVFCTNEMSGEGSSIISLCIRGESSHRSCAIGVGGRSRGARDGERVEADSLESDQVRRGGLAVDLLEVTDGRLGG